MLGDHFAGWWTVNTIAALFQDNGIAPGENTDETWYGARRGTMAEYLATLDLSTDRDTGRLIPVVTEVLEGIRKNNDLSDEFERWRSRLQTDGFTIDAETGRITAPTREELTAGALNVLTPDALNALADPSVIRDHLQHLNDTVDTDPRAAVSTAKDLVESTAKLVLRARGVTFGAAESLPSLVSRAQESLGLAAKQVPTDAPEDTKVLKTILGSLNNLTQGLAELRNRAGRGHGREAVPAWVQPRHARLAAGAAQVWCQLMLETLNDPTAPWQSSPR
jgi:abortive infection Abi-like protein